MPRLSFFFFLYMASMRWVTRKPPKMLTAAMTARRSRTARAQPVPESTASARRRPRAARRRRSPRRWRWSRASAACAAPASPSTPRSSRRRSPARKSRSDRRRIEPQPPPRSRRDRPRRRHERMRARRQARARLGCGLRCVRRRPMASASPSSVRLRFAARRFGLHDGAVAAISVPLTISSSQSTASALSSCRSADPRKARGSWRRAPRRWPAPRPAD